MARKDNAKLLATLKAFNCGHGFVAAIAAKLLRDLGATVHRAAPGGPDPAAAIYPAYETLRFDEILVEEIRVSELMANCDICIVGGEDFPGIARDFELARQLASRFPRLVVLDIQAYPDGAAVDGAAVDILVQARSGLSYEHYPSRANLMTFQPSQYGAALQGVIGALAAVFSRGERSTGQVVSTSLYEGALAWLTTWSEAEKADAAFNFMAPLDPRPLILKCADGKYLHIVLGSAGSKHTLYQILGIEDPSVKPGDSGAPSKDDPPERFYGDIDLLAPYVARWKRDDLATALSTAGVVVAPVLEPGIAWDDPQVRHSGLVDTLANGIEIVGCPIAARIPESVERRPATAREEAEMPLAGVRIVDFGAFTAGPLASLILSRLGADVIKVEPLAGDPCRNLTRAFMAANRGKRSIAIDMKSIKGREIVAKLCSNADAIVSNFRTGVAAKLGIDGETLTKAHPGLIVLECPAFGQTGPRANEVAFDLVMQAFCGFEIRAGGVGNRPLWNRTFLADYGGGQLGAIALIAALQHRQRTGLGCLLEVSLLASAFFLQSETIRLKAGFSGNEILNASQTGFRASEALYRGRNGWIAVAVRDATAAVELCNALGVNSIDASQWRTWGTNEESILASAFESHDVEGLVAKLSSRGIAVERCLDNMERRTLHDAKLRAIGTVEHAQHAAFGNVLHIGSLVRFSRSKQAAPATAPLIGEHSCEILQGLGYSGDEVSAMRSDKVIL